MSGRPQRRRMAGQLLGTAFRLDRRTTGILRIGEILFGMCGVEGGSRRERSMHRNAPGKGVPGPLAVWLLSGVEMKHLMRTLCRQWYWFGGQMARLFERESKSRISATAAVVSFLFFSFSSACIRSFLWGTSFFFRQDF